MAKSRKRKPYVQRLDAWREKTTAEIVNVGTFAALKAERGWHVVGVMGFAGSWRHSGLKGAQLQRRVADATRAMTALIRARRQAHGARLLVSSGATNTGVLEVTYAVCEAEGVLTMGVTPDRTLAYPIGVLNFVLPFGRSYGDESKVFLQTSDELVLMGGGAQSKAETLEGASMGLPVTIIQGFGGAADAFTSKELPEATFLKGVAP